MRNRASGPRRGAELEQNKYDKDIIRKLEKSWSQQEADCLLQSGNKELCTKVCPGCREIRRGGVVPPGMVTAESYYHPQSQGTKERAEKRTT